MTKHVVLLVLAVAAAGAAIVRWTHCWTWVVVPPVTEGQPGTVSAVYDPPMMVLVWLLATAAGVLLVLGVAGLRRRRSALPS